MCLQNSSAQRAGARRSIAGDEGSETVVRTTVAESVSSRCLSTAVLLMEDSALPRDASGSIASTISSCSRRRSACRRCATVTYFDLREIQTVWKAGHPLGTSCFRNARKIKSLAQSSTF